MTRRRIGFAAIALIATLLSTLLAARPALAQRSGAAVGTNLNSNFNSYFNQVGTNFGFNIPAPIPSGGGSAVVGLNAQGLPGPNIMFTPVGGPAVPLGGNQQGGATFGYTVHSSVGNFSSAFPARKGLPTRSPAVRPALRCPTAAADSSGRGRCSRSSPVSCRWSATWLALAPWMNACGGFWRGNVRHKVKTSPTLAATTPAVRAG